MTTKAGGRGTGTLNHLVSPQPIKEYVEIRLEEDRLLDRLSKITAERVQHELALRVAGVSYEDMQDAVVAARPARIYDSAKEATPHPVG